MIPNTPSSTGALWARFRFSVVGSLLSSPPARGALKTAIRSLAAKTWSHPATGRDVQFSAVTIERWYYTARRGHDDPVGALRRAVRKDCGKISLATALAERLDSPVPRPPALELSTALRQPRRLGEGRSFAGAAPLLFHGQALHAGSRLGAQAAASAASNAPAKPAQKRDARRERSAATKPRTSESLWHLDFHHGSLKVLTPGGQWLHPDRAGHPR